ncbi:hypothetical protein THL1_4964 [Pseudomonas sp. TCU-HL1]|nr:hypothetical protein THL1_4964 [Pseudomonas sp. TCU-HL1]
MSAMALTLPGPVAIICFQCPAVERGAWFGGGDEMANNAQVL